MEEEIAEVVDHRINVQPGDQEVTGFELALGHDLEARVEELIRGW
jgi:hypothetical protein